MNLCQLIEVHQYLCSIKNPSSQVKQAKATLEGHICTLISGLQLMKPVA